LGFPSVLAEPIVAPQLNDRRSRILDGAEQCFARQGFHKSTMQDVAHECAMSPGNLYRYFSSKDDLVAGLAERDRERFMGDFTVLTATADPQSTFEALGRLHLVETPVEKAVLMMELWAEAARNPRIGAICRAMDKEVHGIMTAFVSHWRGLEGVTSTTPPEQVASLMMLLGDGLFRQRASTPDFDAEAAFRLIYPIVLHAIGVPQSSYPEAQ
jgi:TetR/AcrR family transcriptional regulator, repressor for uid operon